MMNKHIFFGAAALLAAPVCLAAEGATCEAFINESIDMLGEVATILEGVTPDTADESLAKLDALKPKMDALSEKGKQFSESEQQQTLMGSQELQSKMQAVMGRVFGATMKIAMTMQNASPEDQAKVQKVLARLQSMGPEKEADDMDDEDDED